MKTVDISIILNLHRENYYLRPTLYSLNATIEFAKKFGVTTELIAVFDNSNEITRDTFFETEIRGAETVKTKEINVASLGLARNSGIELAEGKFIWTADADDLISENCLYQLWKTATENEKKRLSDISRISCCFWFCKLHW